MSKGYDEETYSQQQIIELKMYSKVKKQVENRSKNNS